MGNKENNNIYAVVTTIQEPTDCMRGLAVALGAVRGKLLVMGDKKGPASFDLEGVEFVSLAEQLELSFSLAPLLPTGHYGRKNLGYLLAAQYGATCIYETDDDNAPTTDWAVRSVKVEAQEIPKVSWLNVYRLFSDELIWPRGFPLSLVRDPNTCPDTTNSSTVEIEAPIQQGLADNSPDVDALWRLVLDRDFQFEKRRSVYLPPGTWCPFNSQSTWWWPMMYPLMYLPSYCSFRMTDIWRSFIALRCLWESGYGMVFHAPEVVQERNIHNLMRDFKDEVPGYLGNEEITRRLHDLSLDSGFGAVSENLRKCYESLVKAKFFPPEELPLVHAWLEDIEKTKTVDNQSD